MRRAAWIVVTALACSEADPSRLEGFASPDARSRDDADSRRPDGRAADARGAPDTGVAGDGGRHADAGAACDAFEPVYIRGSDMLQLDTLFEVRPGRVDVNETGPRGPVQRTVDVASGGVTVRRDGTRVADARDGHWVTIRVDDESTTVVHESGSGPLEYRLSPVAFPIEFGGLDLRRQRLVDARRVTLADAANSRILRLENGSVIPVASTGAPPPKTPFLGDNRIVWSIAERGGRGSIIVAHDIDSSSSVSRTRGVATIETPVVVGEDVVWMENGRVHVADGMLEGVEPLGPEGPCRALVSDGREAFFVCSDGEASFFGDALYRIRDRIVSEVRRVPGGAIFSPDFTDEWLAWIEYPSEEDLLIPRDATRGTMVVIERESKRRYEMEVGAGCYACALVWPLPQVRLSTDIVAWAYARADPGGEWGMVPLGAAFLPTCN